MKISSSLWKESYNSIGEAAPQNDGGACGLAASEVALGKKLRTDCIGNSGCCLLRAV
jgi:hypothetical protein